MARGISLFVGCVSRYDMALEFQTLYKGNREASSFFGQTDGSSQGGESDIN